MDKEFIQSKLRKVSSLITPNSKILDVGCRDDLILKFLPKCDYFCIDINQKAIDSMKDKGIKAEQVDLNKEPIPFKNKKFDYILLLDILEHIVHPAGLLDELKTRLKQGGKIIVSLPNDYHILNKIRFILNKPLTEDSFAPYGHLHVFPIKQGNLLLKNQGFKIINRYFLAPNKPIFIPNSLKKFLSNLFPQTFARNVLYVVSIK